MRTLYCGVVVSTVLLLSACQEGPAAPTSPTVVPNTQASHVRSASGPPDVPGPQSTQVTRVPREVRADRRAARSSDKGIGERPYGKPEPPLVRSADGTQITADWTMSSDPHVNNYEVHWAPADRAGWWPRGESDTWEPPFTFTPEVGGMSPHGAWKVRVRARNWRPHVSFCCVGPWSDPVVIGEYGSVPLCYVGQVLRPGDSCYVDPGLRFEVTSDGRQGCLHVSEGPPTCFPDGYVETQGSERISSIVRIPGTNNFRVELVPER